MDEASALAEARLRSLSRSRSRSRNPSELLARKQQLLAASNFDSLSAGETAPIAANNIADSPAELQTRGRAAKRLEANNHQQQLLSKQVHLSTDTEMMTATDYGGKTVSSAEAKLENLSQMLKSHQQQQQDETNLDQQQTSQPTTSGSTTATTITTNSSTLQAAAKSIDDVYILLAKKEKDLQLAAELGKVLLEKNDELSKANERITEDYSHKLELLEQDKHKLRRKLDLLEGDYENRLIELQTDCNILKNQLEEQQQVARKAEKEKSKLIDDLAQQNQRLTSELFEATKSEELLSSQLEQVNERFNVRLSSRQDHVAQLEALKQEIQIINQRKQDLERRLKLANNDKANLSAALEESGDKLLHLENLLTEKEARMGELVDELGELRDSSSWLSSELESMISMNDKLANSSNGNNNDDSQPDPHAINGQRKRSQLIDQLRELRLRNQSRLKANEFMLINRHKTVSSSSYSTAAAAARLANERRRRAKRPRDDASLLEELDESGANNKLLGQQLSGSSSPDNDNYGSQEQLNRLSSSGAHSNGASTPSEWREELAMEVYALLRRFQANLQQRRDALMRSANQQQQQLQQQQQAAGSFNQTNAGQHLYSPNSTDDSGISTADDVDKTSNDEHEQMEDPATWKALLESLRCLIEEMPCSSCYLMIAERADYEQLQKLHAKLCDQIRRKDDELLALTATKTEQEAKLVALEERNSLLSNDLSNCDKPKEEIVKLAWKARDEAVERKNAAEISLAKTRIENMQIASQLMEVVQQKGELSQKLAQFEDDIHYITQDSVKAKFTWEEHAEKLRRTKLSQPDSSLNPLASFLSFSSKDAGNTTCNGTTSTTTRLSAIDNLAQPVSLMRNLTNNARFNLKFWQRSQPGKEPVAVNVGDK